jgi:hypothetical protein
MTKKSYDSILIESLHHKMDMVIESLQEFDAGSRQRDMEIKQELKQDLTQEIQLTRYELKQTRSELKQDIALVQSAVQMLSKEVLLIHKRLDQHDLRMASF